MTPHSEQPPQAAPLPPAGPLPESGPPPNGWHWVCQRSTHCCRWPGAVRLTDADITRIAAFLRLTEWDFIQKHTTLHPDRRGLVLLEKSDGSCEFLEGRDCLIHAAKPAQCRGFPNTWNFPGWRKTCRAVLMPQPGPNSGPPPAAQQQTTA